MLHFFHCWYFNAGLTLRGNDSRVALPVALGEVWQHPLPLLSLTHEGKLPEERAEATEQAVNNRQSIAGLIHHILNLIRLDEIIVHSTYIKLHNSSLVLAYTNIIQGTHNNIQQTTLHQYMQCNASMWKSLKHSLTWVCGSMRSSASQRSRTSWIYYKVIINTVAKVSNI